jgi:hypothetical protein
VWNLSAAARDLCFRHSHVLAPAQCLVGGMWLASLAMPPALKQMPAASAAGRACVAELLPRVRQANAIVRWR